VAQLAATRDQPAPLGRESRLGDALAGLAQDLAVARRQIAVLKRANAALRSRLHRRGSEVVDRCSPPGAETAGFREPVG
jgi:hypothetical protein